MMAERGLKPEMEIFNDSQMDEALMMIGEGCFTPPYSFSFVTNMHKVNQGAVAFSPKRLMGYVDLLPPGSLFSTLGVGAAQLPACVQSVLLGGIVRDLGLEVASPDEARRMPGVPALGERAPGKAAA